MCVSTCSLQRYLHLIPGGRSDYEHLARFHYQPGVLGPVRAIYQIVDENPWRRRPVSAAGVIVYGVPSANLAARNAATGGMFAGLDRAAGLALLNERMVCIRRVIIEPRYRGLGLATRLVAETMPMTGAAMVEAVSVMGRVHPFFKRAGMTAFGMPPDAKTARMAAALEAVGVDESLWHDGEAVHATIEALPAAGRAFVEEQIRQFCEKFTNRRKMPHGPERTAFALSKLTARGEYYLWDASGSMAL